MGRTGFKVYGLLADGKALTDDLLEEAESYVRHALPTSIESEGCDHGLGFVIVHPGDLGVTITAHWWVQGSVLCQRVRRRLYGAVEPIDTATRPVIACVWELALIDAEQRIWRETMMNDRPDPSASLKARATATHV